MNAINRNELKELLEGGEKFTLLDVMPPEYHAAMHLPSAKNCCVYEVTFLQLVEKTAPDKEHRLVVYGSSAHSLASTTAAEKLERAGYMQVLDYRGGLEDWLEGALPVERGEAAPQEIKPELGRHVVDLEKSIVLWTGRNVNGAHNGRVKLKSGWLELEERGGGVEGSGEFILDMESITDTDLTNAAMNAMLVAHLKSDDFFDTTRFPIATFHLRHVTLNKHARPGSVNADISGALTLKGVSADLGFPALVEVLPDGALGVEAHFDIDRTRWNVIYGSGKFYEWLGKHLVHDIISLEVRLLTRPGQGAT